jgi:hypothetical protein
MSIIVVSFYQMKAGFTGSPAIWLSLFTSVVSASIQLASLTEEGAFDGVSAFFNYNRIVIFFKMFYF